MASTTTAADGTYTAPALPSGTGYTVCFTDSPTFTAQCSQGVAVISGITTPGVDAALTTSVTVTSSAQLSAALAAAVPGEVIQVADGTYSGAATVGTSTAQFAITRSGTAAAPITLRGSRAAVISSGTLATGYGLYLSGASYWHIEGFTVTSVAKGIVLDGSNHNTISGAAVTGVGDEGIHLRSFSSDNVVTGAVVTRTGLRQPSFGEGIYVGSANTNWPTYSGGLPDASDRNQLIGNTVNQTPAENVDIKEGTSSGLVAENVFDGTGMSGKNSADSLIDVKGNSYRISANTGSGGLLDAFQVHNVIDGWGNDNVFSANQLTVGVGGYGVNVSRARSRTVVGCDNTVSGGGTLTNLTCTP